MGPDRQMVRKKKRPYDGIILIATALIFYCGILTWGSEDEADLEERAFWINSNRTLPSLNLFDYERTAMYPIFEEYPGGIQRNLMPQFNVSAASWHAFESSVKSWQGDVKEEVVNLLELHPMQAELSGFILYNVLYGEEGLSFDAKLRMDPNFVEHGVIVLRTSLQLKTPSGLIPKGALMVLDGHHTTAAALLCAKQRGMKNIRSESFSKSICNGHFSTLRKLKVVSGLHPLVVRLLAFQSGNGGAQQLTPSVDENAKI